MNDLIVFLISRVGTAAALLALLALLREEKNRRMSLNTGLLAALAVLCALVGLSDITGIYPR